MQYFRDADESKDTAMALDGDEEMGEKAMMETGALREMYPPFPPYESGMLTVDADAGHKMYFEQSGDPDGLPALFVHGGPGAGCGPGNRQLFNPALYRVVMFHQRGSGKSLPRGSIVNNTTKHLVGDIEVLRKHLGIDKWAVVVGGSWGALLAVLYAQQHACRVGSLVLRGIFLGSAAEIGWLFERGGASEHFPDAFDKYVSFIPAEERGNLVAAYYKRLTSSDQATRRDAAVSMAAWEDSLTRVCEYEPRKIRAELMSNMDYVEGFARIESHYMANSCFVNPAQVLAGVAKLAGLEVHIIHGRLDVVCRPRVAYTLHKALPASTLTFVYDAGHSVAEPGIMDAMLRTLDAIGFRKLQALARDMPLSDPDMRQ